MEDEKRRRRLLWIAVIIAALSVIGATSIIFDSSMTFGRIVLVLMLIPVILLVFALIVNPRPKRDDTDPTQPIVKQYEDKNTTVTVKYQGFALDVLRLPSPPMEELHSKAESLPDEFPARRGVINVVVARRDNPDLLVTKVNPPLELRVGYTAADLKHAQDQGRKYPLFGYWDGCHWVLFTEQKHQLRYEPSDRADLAGYAVVSLDVWSDPRLAYGP
jgi:hypothetical protein